MKKIDIGIVGLGTTGKQHLNFYLENKCINKIFI